jgi:phenylacetate-CoA ligase
MEDFLYRFKDIYINLPYKIKRFIGYFYNLIPISFRYGNFFLQYQKRIKIFEENQYEKLLFENVNYAIENIPFYKGLHRISSLKEFHQFPVVNKKIINARKNEFINPNLSNKLLKSNTGGSSGNPFEFYLHKGITRPKEKAHFSWFWGNFGFKKGDKILSIRGNPLPNGKKFEYLSIDNKLSVSCYNINSFNIEGIIEEIEEFQPKFIHAYPSSLRIITTILKECKINLKISITSIFLSSEYLNEDDRNLFESYYKAKIVIWYGHSECLIHGGNCNYSNHYHMYPFYGYTELLDEDDLPIKEANKIGRIVATGFDNKVMPLIRYDTGDLGILAENKKCICGFKGTIIKEIIGRTGDFIILKDKTKVSVTAFIFGQHLEAFNAIIQMQIIQNKIGHITIVVVKSSNYNEDIERKLKNTLIKSVDNKLTIDIEYKEEIEKTSRGKQKLLVQNLK